MANTITLTDIADRRVFAGDLGSVDIPVAGTFTSSGAPPAIQAQVIKGWSDVGSIIDMSAVTDMAALTGAVVVPWTTIVASPAGGTFSGTISVPKTNDWLKLQVRFADASAESDGTHEWAVGVLVLCIGQSNMQNMWLSTSASPPFDPGLSYYDPNPLDPPHWLAPGTEGKTGDGAIAFGAALRSFFGAPVGLILGAVGGSALGIGAVNPSLPLLYWLHQGGNPANYPDDYMYQAVADAVTALGDISAIIWLQGEQEVSAGYTNTAQYIADYSTLYGRLLTLTSRSAATLLFHVGIIGYASYGAGVVDGIRAAQITVGEGGNGFRRGPCTFDAPMLNEAPAAIQHHTPAGYVTLGHRWAMQVAYWLPTVGSLSACPGTSPRITGVTRAGKSMVLTVTQPPGALFLGQLVHGPSASGFVFSTDNFVTTVVPTYVGEAATDFTSDLTQVSVAFASNPGAQIQFHHQDGQPASLFPIAAISNLLYGGRNPPGEPLGLPLCHTAGVMATGEPAPFGGVPIFPTLAGLAFDVVRTPILSTNLQENISGKQIALGYWSNPKYQWELTFEFLRQGSFGGISYAEQQQLMSFFNVLAGRLGTFLWLDPDDFQVSNQIVGVGDGTTLTFQLVRSIGASGSTENVLAPNFDAVSPTGLSPLIAVNGVTATNAIYARYGNNQGAAPGTITFGTAPGNGAIVTASFWYYWPVRFDDDKMTFNKFMSTLYAGKKVTFTSVK